jgi:ABC-type sugar transport system ATPase subunit
LPLLDGPSVGIAHRLKMEIFESIRAIRDAATAVLLVEQDTGSTLAVADRCAYSSPAASYVKARRRIWPLMRKRPVYLRV